MLIMATVIIRSTVWYLQDLNAVFYSLFHPGIQDAFNWSETGPIIKGGEETHADGAGQGRRSGYPPASLVKGLYGGKMCLFTRENKDFQTISKIALNANAT